MNLGYVSQVFLARSVLDKAINDVERNLSLQSPACKMQLEPHWEHSKSSYKIAFF
jgi:hypothetical protein